MLPAAAKYLWTDKGGEFYNKQMQDYLKRIGVVLYRVHGQSKAAPVERLNKTLKHIMLRILTERQSHAWVGILHDVVENKPLQQQDTFSHRKDAMRLTRIRS